MNTFHPSRSGAVVLAVAMAMAFLAHADHGPGTSGGGALTQSAETLKPRAFSLELREDYTEFERLSTSEIEAKAERAGGIDMLDRSFLSTVSIGYGVAENVQLGLAFGYYLAVNARGPSSKMATRRPRRSIPTGSPTYG